MEFPSVTDGKWAEVSSQLRRSREISLRASQCDEATGHVELGEKSSPLAQRSGQQKNKKRTSRQPVEPLFDPKNAYKDRAALAVAYGMGYDVSKRTLALQFWEQSAYDCRLSVDDRYCAACTVLDLNPVQGRSLLGRLLIEYRMRTLYPDIVDLLLREDMSQEGMRQIIIALKNSQGVKELVFCLICLKGEKADLVFNGITKDAAARQRVLTAIAKHYLKSSGNPKKRLDAMSEKGVLLPDIFIDALISDEKGLVQDRIKALSYKVEHKMSEWRACIISFLRSVYIDPQAMNEFVQALRSKVDSESIFVDILKGAGCDESLPIMCRLKIVELLRRYGYKMEYSEAENVVLGSIIRSEELSSKNRVFCFERLKDKGLKDVFISLCKEEVGDMSLQPSKRLQAYMHIPLEERWIPFSVQEIPSAVRDILYSIKATELGDFLAVLDKLLRAIGGFEHEPLERKDFLPALCLSVLVGFYYNKSLDADGRSERKALDDALVFIVKHPHVSYGKAVFCYAQEILGTTDYCEKAYQVFDVKCRQSGFDLSKVRFISGVGSLRDLPVWDYEVDDVAWDCFESFVKLDLCAKVFGQDMQQVSLVWTFVLKIMHLAYDDDVVVQMQRESSLRRRLIGLFNLIHDMDPDNQYACLQIASEGGQACEDNAIEALDRLLLKGLVYLNQDISDAQFPLLLLNYVDFLIEEESRFQNDGRESVETFVLNKARLYASGLFPGLEGRAVMPAYHLLGLYSSVLTTWEGVLGRVSKKSLIDYMLHHPASVWRVAKSGQYAIDVDKACEEAVKVCYQQRESSGLDNIGKEAEQAFQLAKLEAQAEVDSQYRMQAEVYLREYGVLLKD